MDRIALAVEPSLDYRHEIPEAHEQPTIGQAMSNAACDIAEALAAKAIVVPTFTRPHGVGGGAASAAAADHRGHPPGVLAAAHGARVGRDAARDRPRPTTSRTSGAVARSRPRASGIVEPGDRVVITAGTAVNIPGSTNVIKVDIA